MPTNIQFNLLTWDNISNLPFPPEVQEIISDVKWDEFEWHVAGLPLLSAKYNMLDGKILYLAELPDGEPKIQKLDTFTGNVLLSAFFLNEKDKDGFNYYVNFLVTIIRGAVDVVALSQVDKQPVKEYLEAMEDFEKDIKRVTGICEAWWFKWLYRPYFLSIRFIVFVICFILRFIQNAIIWVATQLTPL